MAKIKIKKIRSEIKRPGDQKKTLLALGLKKIGQVVEHEDLSLIHISEPTRRRGIWDCGVGV